jgi:hypothetical protein
MDLDGISRIDTGLDSRAACFENPRGDRGAGGQAASGRKGAAAGIVDPGGRLALVEATGPGIIRHIWLTFPHADPVQARSLRLDGYYDGADKPSISVPVLDFFGLAHGRVAAYTSALTDAREGRGFNAWIPMPFREGVRLELVNASDTALLLYFQVDYSLQPVAEDAGYLHVSFRRENPTTPGLDFTIVEGLTGPGRFLGCVLGIRVIDRKFWYGEGEVKFYRDGDSAHPTICGTGLEDYVGTAWGMGAHFAAYGGAPFSLGADPDGGQPSPELVSCYRWHIADPIVFHHDFRVTVQQIGFATFRPGEEAEFRRYARAVDSAGRGWRRDPDSGLILGLYERSDDYSAAAFVYCRQPQAVPITDPAGASDDVAWREWEPRADVEWPVPPADLARRAVPMDAMTLEQLTHGVQ